MMRQNLFTKPGMYALAALAFVALASPSFAQGHGGGASGAHMSTQGAANTNGPNSSDRDTGKARSQDRAAAHAQTHAKTHAKTKKTTK